MTKHTQEQTKKLVLGAILTALVIILQMMGSFIRFGMFSISLVLVPMVRCILHICRKPVWRFVTK